MGRLLSFIIICLCFYVFFQTYWIWWIRQARQKGIYPPKDKATMFDVRRLILQGEKELAIRLYCEIFRAARKDAKKAVEELERSALKKNIDSE